MNIIISKLKEYRRKRHELHLRRRRAYIESTFQVEERAGELILTKDGVAINHFQHLTSAEEIVASLKTARETAIQFSSHELCATH